MKEYRAQKKSLLSLWSIGILAVFFAGYAVAADLPVPDKKPVRIHPVKTTSSIMVAPLRPVNVNLTAPLPDKKPRFDAPETEFLLRFGTPPVPGHRPMPAGFEPLSEKNATLYKKIFSYQTAGQWKKADELIAQLDDFRLRGHVLYQRYMHPTAYRTSFEELAGWLDLYADHPGADKIYNLAMARLPGDFKGTVNKPRNSRNKINIRLDVMYDKGKDYHSPKRRSRAENDGIAGLKKAIRSDISRGGPTRAYKRLLEDPRAKALDIVEYDQIMAQIASSYMFVGKLDKAEDLALASAKRSGNKVPLAGWVGGLVSWRKGNYQQAAPLFTQCATSPYSSPWESSAGAYWASRAYTRTGNIKQVGTWLKRAADHPRTFYGLIAIEALGGSFDFDWSMPEFTENHKNALNKNPAGFRAMALATAGQYHLAEAEMKQISPGKNNSLAEALIAYTDHAGLPSFSMRLASAFEKPEGGYYDAALYPLAPWRPENGYNLDKALLYAFVRQESKFDPQAESHSGATGLMQLMPTTASFITGDKKYTNRDGQHVLTDPHINLGIGQKYINYLLGQNNVDQDLLSLAIAYNAGPGNLRRWQKEMDNMRDPLLFVESIPMGETRVFVERVLANYWIYRIRMDQKTPSLASIAKGDRARYVELDGIMQADARSAETPSEQETTEQLSHNTRRYN